MDTQLQGYIEQVFRRYDRDNNGWLDIRELAGFVNEVLGLAGSQNRNMDQQQIFAIAGNMDKNRDGRITKI